VRSKSYSVKKGKKKKRIIEYESEDRSESEVILPKIKEPKVNVAQDTE
jgi:hypothetical protein